MAYKNFSARTDNWTNEHESGAHFKKRVSLGGWDNWHRLKNFVLINTFHKNLTNLNVVKTD